MRGSIACTARQGDRSRMLGPCAPALFEFAQADKTPGVLAHEAIAFIAKLYAVESKVKDRAPDEKLAARQAEAVPVLGEFKSGWRATTRGRRPGDHSAKRYTTPSATGMRWFATATTAYWSPTTTGWNALYDRSPWVARHALRREALGVDAPQRRLLLDRDRQTQPRSSPLPT